MEFGFPGNVEYQVSYEVTADRELVISYLALPDKKTAINITNHTYFNLNGATTGSVEKHTLWIKADAFTPVRDANAIPTGEDMPVEGTPFDFRVAKEIRGVSNKVLKVHYGLQNWYDNTPNTTTYTNYLHNKNVDLSSYKDGYINDQNTGAVSKLRFGATTMNNNGCEIIAAYNAMKVLGNQKDLRDIAYHFENDGQMLGGYFGTNPYANKRFFEKEGYKVKVVEGEKIMEDKLPKADAYILSFWNSDNVMDALHTVAMRRTKDGKYELFNYESRTDNKSKITSNFVYELLENREIPLSVHCISK